MTRSFCLCRRFLNCNRLDVRLPNINKHCMGVSSLNNCNPPNINPVDSARIRRGHFVFSDLESRYNRIDTYWKSSTAIDANQRELSSCASDSSPSKATGFASLTLPEKLYEDNHILVVNKPAGWHSVPNEIYSSSKRSSSKCLLSYLKDKKWGGGSEKSFLLPLHRIDQPCTGILIFAKTSKAASRIAKLWKQKKVIKTYVCVVNDDYRLDHLVQQSTRISNESDNEHYFFDYRLSGYMQRRRHRYQTDTSNSNNNNKKGNRGWSVTMTKTKAITSAATSTSGDHRPVQLDWKLVTLLPSSLKTKPAATDNKIVLMIRTDSGARHMIRGLLSQIGHCPITGDVRYGYENEGPPDRSVALHAYGLILPGETSLKLNIGRRNFVAPIPKTWEFYWGIAQNQIPRCS